VGHRAGLDKTRGKQPFASAANPSAVAHFIAIVSDDWAT